LARSCGKGAIAWWIIGQQRKRGTHCRTGWKNQTKKKKTKQNKKKKTTPSDMCIEWLIKKIWDVRGLKRKGQYPEIL